MADFETSATTATANAATTAATNATNQTNTGDGDNNGVQEKEKEVNQATNSQFDEEKIARMVQAQVDKITAKLGKEKADLQNQLDTLKKEKLSEEELKQLEIKEKEDAIAERERAIEDKENRLYAIKAIKAAGLDDGSDKALELVDFVMGGDKEDIDKKVDTFKAIMDKFVRDEVDKTFKAHGRNPEKGGDVDSKNQNTLAADLGKRAAERNQKAQDVLKNYIR